MRRVLIIARVAALYLLLGFVTTWAVAWGLAALMPPGEYSHSISTPDSPGPFEAAPFAVQASVYTNFGTNHVSYWTTKRDDPVSYLYYPWPDLLRAPSESTSLCKTINSDFWIDLQSQNEWGGRSVVLCRGPSSHVTIGIDDGRGFPVLALWCGWKGDLPTGRVIPESLTGGIPLSSRAGSNPNRRLRALPYMPIWSGLALNTAFYALVFFAVVRTLRSFRRGRRRDRGLCPRCKYDREFDYRLPCPECGDAPRGKRRERQTAAVAR